MTEPREFDIVLWGATGFTGKLTAEHLFARHGGDGATLRWALGGRNQAKLEAVRAELGEAAAALPLVVGDGADDAFLAAMAARTKVVCTTVGPYAKYGSGLVSACAAAGTHYCDLTGEAHWMKAMIEAHHDRAVASGARIVFTCGFDCIPSDLGTWFVQQQMRQLHGVAAARVQLRVAGMRGGASGGTIASGLHMFEQAAADPSVMAAMRDPYSLNPPGQQSGPDGPEPVGPWYDEAFGEWSAPFVMAGVNTKVVRRSNALLDFAWGRQFRYDEGVLSGKGPAGMLKASAAAAAMAGAPLMGVGPIRRAVAKRLPQPGTGPSQRAREAGFFDLRLIGHHPSDASKNVEARVRGNRDPGYGATSRMLGESALCLAQDTLSVGGGAWTPASAMAEPLLSRLVEHAGMTFERVAR